MAIGVITCYSVERGDTKTLGGPWRERKESRSYSTLNPVAWIQSHSWFLESALSGATKKLKKKLQEPHTPPACWLGSGTCSAAVTQSRDYWGVHHWHTAETLTARQLRFSTRFSESVRTNFRIFSTGYRNNHPMETTPPYSQQTPISKTALLLVWQVRGVINQLFWLLGQGNWKENPGE